MKISLALHPRRPLTRSEAWGCFTANLALPGSGSLVAGRRMGYFQMLLAMVALGISLIETFQAVVWFVNHWSELNQDKSDPFANLSELWRIMRGPLFGLALFVAAIVWATITSLQILAASPKNNHA